MALTKATYSMISGAVVNVFDYLPADQIALIQARTTAGQNASVITAGIQAAIDSLGAYAWQGTKADTETQPSGGVVYFPAGIYKFNSTIKLPSQIYLLGESTGRDITTGGTVLFASGFSTNNCWALDVITYNASGVRYTAWDVYLTGAALLNATYAQNVTIKNMEIKADTPGATTPTGGVRSLKGEAFNLENVNIRNFYVGIYTQWTWNTTWKDVYVLCAWYGAVLMDETNGITMLSCNIDRLSDVSAFDVLSGINAPSFLFPSQVPVTDGAKAYYTAGIYARNGVVNASGLVLQRWDSAMTCYEGRYALIGAWFEQNVTRMMGIWDAYFSLVDCQFSGSTYAIDTVGGIINIPNGYQNQTGAPLFGTVSSVRLINDRVFRAKANGYAIEARGPNDDTTFYTDTNGHPTAGVIYKMVPVSLATALAAGTDCIFVNSADSKLYFIDGGGTPHALY